MVGLLIFGVLASFGTVVVFVPGSGGDTLEVQPPLTTNITLLGAGFSDLRSWQITEVNRLDHELEFTK